MMLTDAMNVAMSLFNYIRPNSPYDKGQLRDRGFLGPYLQDFNVCQFYIGGPAAPHGPWLHEFPTIWGHPNRHQNWIQDRLEEGLAVMNAEIVDVY